MVREKDSFWEYAKDLGKGRFSCNFCQKKFAGGISRIKSHLSGLRGRDIKICQQVDKAVQLEAREALRVIGTPTKKLAKCVAASSNVLEGKSASSYSSSHMSNLCEGHDKNKVDKLFAMYSISEKVCFDAIESPFFKDFVTGVAEYGPGYELPSSSTLKLQLIPNIKKEVEEYVENVIKYARETGCTLMYNMKSDFIWADIFAYTPKGVACIDPAKTNSEEIVLGEESLSSIMELIEPKNVVQFIINNNGGDHLNPTKDMLLRKYPWICQTPCAARGIEVLWNKIYEVSFVWNTIKVAELIALYIYKYKVNVSLRKVHRKKQFFASDFLMLMSLLEVEHELRDSQESIGTTANVLGKLPNYESTVEFVRRTAIINCAIYCEKFWSVGKTVAQVMKPLFQAHCLVECDGPTSGYLYEIMERVQDAVEGCRDSNHVLYDVISKILKEVRSDIIHPIHAAAALLNPMYVCSEKFVAKNEMNEGLEYLLKHLVAEKENEAVKSQFQLYWNRAPNLFTPQACTMLQTSHPRIWWKFCGNDLPEIQKYAIRILSQPCSYSSCKRYQLRDSYNDDHAFMVNTMMMERYKLLETQMTEPIILDKLGEISNNDWDDDCDDDYEKAFKCLSFGDEIANDPSGSWLDRSDEATHFIELPR